MTDPHTISACNRQPTAQPSAARSPKTAALKHRLLSSGTQTLQISATEAHLKKIRCFQLKTKRSLALSRLSETI